MTQEAQDQNSFMKQQLLATFFTKYSELIDFVNSLPIHFQFKQNAVTRFDEGMFWTREGISLIQTVDEPTQEASTESSCEPEKL